MGKLGPRLGSRRKAKRWAKGQSSSSNPSVTKHREQSANLFFQNFRSSSGITREDVQKHDALQGIEHQLAKFDIDEDRSTEKTAITSDTFATSYSKCSNVSFTKFLEHFQSSSLVHKKVLVVLATVTEIIKERGGTESSTEYFAALMTTLDTVKDDVHVVATLSLLGMCMKTVPKNVLNLKFGTTSQTLVNILTKYVVTEHFLILRHCIGCLSVLLRVQEAATWANASTAQVVDAILSFTTHAKPKVRKSAQHAICAILRASDVTKSENPPTYHPAAGQVATYCIAQLDAACGPGSSQGVATILHTLTLLRDTLHLLQKSHVKTICERLLSIMTLKNVLITSCCLQTLHGLFASRPSEATLPTQRNADIIRALYDYQPSATDTQPTLAWLTVMREAHCNLIHVSSSQLCSDPGVGLTLDSLLPRIISKCIELWMSDKTEVIASASHTIKIILQECVAPLCETEEEIKRYNGTLKQIVSIMHKALSYQYLEAWRHILHLTALLFDVTGKLKLAELVDVVKSLGELRDSKMFGRDGEVEYAIGAAIRTMGPQLVLNALPLGNDNDEINWSRGWIIPLLKDCITGGTIAFFRDVLLPIALTCEKKAKEPIVGKTYEFLVPQIWSVLPSLCNDASDVRTNFTSDFAVLLGMIVRDKKDLRLFGMAALRKLISRATQNGNADDIAQLARFAKNYLPILFTVYTTKPCGTDEEGQRLAALDTIKIYMTIANTDLANELFDQALGKLNEDGTDEFFKQSVHDLLRTLIGYTDVARLNKYYSMCEPVLMDDSKKKAQKKAYRFLMELCDSDKQVCEQFVKERRRDIQKLLMVSGSKVCPTSRKARLACLTHLVKIHPQLENTKFLEAIVPETVLCVKDINTGCRKAAYKLLNMIAEKFLNNREYLKTYVDMMIVGLGGDQETITNSLLCLTSITHRYNAFLDAEIIEEILEEACTLLTNDTREIVDCALSYVKIYVGAKSSFVVVPKLPRIINALSQMNEDCKRHFRYKVRDVLTKLIRKYGIKMIFDMIPTTDVIMHKRLKNINKLEDAKRKKREAERAIKQENDTDEEFSVKREPKSIEEILADSDEEFEATENEEKPKKTKKSATKTDAWIRDNEEDIVDLIDPTAVRNITTTQPTVTSNSKIPNSKKAPQKDKDYGFKIAPDGRFIITDDKEKDDSDAEEGNKKKRKKLASFLHSDSEDDYKDNDDISVATSKVDGRKRKYSENMSDIMSSKSLQSTSRYQAGGSGIHRPLKARKVEREPGSEYRSTKARGDIKKKGKPDPYAYIQLKRSALNKRKQKKNAGRFKSIVSGATKGARIGFKNKQRKH
ncbi:RRP12-like protein [Pseudomyrmex gracilis]|uniref:RRP12-like protein n=1 Tax=Pseudomyrmex gracilis TaxID=219809 RepID=UPI0009958B4D|nr:RRP12-like protein [Pseudomyrmex gracilis]